MKKTVILCLFYLVFALIPAASGYAQNQQEGNATWYDTPTQGLNASHSRLPLGTRLLVTNLENGKQATVTINNRMPNSPDRILNLSRSAAVELGMEKNDVVRIRLEVVKEEVVEAGADEDEWAFLFADTTPSAPADDVLVAADSGDADDEDDDQFLLTEADDFSADDEPAPPPQKQDPVPPASVAAPAAKPAAKTSVWIPPALPVNTPIFTSPPPVYTPASSPAPVAPPSPSVSAAPAVPPTSVKTGGAVASAQPAVPATDSKMSVKVIVTINGQEYTVDIPDVNTPAKTQVPPPAIIEQPVVVVPSSLAISIPVPGGAPAKIIPKMPDSRNGRMYRVQVGAFSNTTFAQSYFDRLQNAGFRPAFEQSGNLYRVVVSGIRSVDMEQVAQRLGSAGFKEAWIREE